MSKQIDVVFWDFGGVFTGSPFGPANSAYAQSLGTTLDELVDLVLGYHTPDGDHPWHQVERGELEMSEAFKVLSERVQGSGYPDFHMKDFFAAMGSGNKKLGEAKANPDMVQLLEDVKQAGVRNCIITNNVKEFSTGWRGMINMELFDGVVDSSEAGIRKPDPAIYHLALKVMGSPAPERTAFLDDFGPNLDAAAKLGIKPVLVAPDRSSAIAQLRSVVGI